MELSTKHYKKNNQNENYENNTEENTINEGLFFRYL